jgi:predicted nucleic acid-binding protein
MGSRRVSAAYLDTSALVKLFKDEPETQALRQALAHWPVRVASELIRVEAICTARRLGDPAMIERAKTALTRLTLLPLTPEIIDLATGEHRPALRAMDALHLASALSVREELGAMFVYDTDLNTAASHHDLNPLAPD